MMLYKNLIISLRNLNRNKFSGFIGIFGFAIGFSISLIISIYIYGELTVDHQHTDYQNIYRLIDNDKNSSQIDYKLNQNIRENYAAVINSCPIEIRPEWEADVYTDQEPCYVKGLISTSNKFFEMFNIKLIRSMDNKNPFINNNSSILTQSAARKIFGDSDPLGQHLKVSHIETVVSAVIENFETNSSIQGQILVNSEDKNNRLSNYFSNGEVYSVTNHFLLLNNSSKAELEQVLNNSLSKYTKHHKSFYLQPFKEIYLDKTIPDEFRHGSKDLLIVLSVIGTLILLLSVVNYINYSLTLQAKRLPTISIKKTNGAGFKHLLNGFLVDTATWITIAFGISIPLTSFLIPIFNQHLGKKIEFANIYNSSILAGISSVIVFVVLISLIPIITMLSKFDLSGSIRNNLQNDKKFKRLNLLTVFQLSVSIFLIVVFIGIKNQISYIKQKDLGFNDNALLHIDIPNKALNYERFKNELLAHTAIEKASLSSGTPGKSLLRVNHKDWNSTLHIISMDTDFITTMGITLVEGRMITPNDKDKCLINETGLKAMKFDDFSTTNYGRKEIVGVVKDFNFSSLHQKIQPIMLQIGTGRDLSVKIAKDKTIEAMDYIESVWDEMADGKPLKYEFYDTWFDSMYKKEEQLGNAVSIFALVAIIITCLGLLSQIFQITDNRTKEIGIRKVNGAKIFEIFALLNKSFLQWSAIAFIFATPIAYYTMSKWLENFAYKTEISWWVFAMAGAIASGITILTVSIQSYRTASRNPVEALRYE